MTSSRAFGTRWAKRIMPAVLKRLMRDSEIGTTMKFYVTMDADAVADEVWGRNWESGNTSGNNRPREAPDKQMAPPMLIVLMKAVAAQRVSA